MRRKIITVCVFLVIILAILSPMLFSPIIYHSSHVKVSKVKPKEEKQITQFSWIPLTEVQAYRNHSVILTGKVKNVREAKVEYAYNGTDQTDYITLADFVVSDFYNNSKLRIKSGDTLTVGHSITSYNFATDVPEFQEGKEYILFCTVPSEQMKDSVMELGEYMDCWVMAPNQLILKKVGDHYPLNDFWDQVLPNTPFAKYETIKGVIDAGVSKYWLGKDIDVGTGETQETTPWTHEAALTRFLQDTNHNGKIQSSGKVDPPGTLPEVWQIPAADQSMVGETVPIILAKGQQAIPFYYSYQNSGVERLAVVLRAEGIPMLILFETKLYGIDALYDKIATETEFPAKILSITNMSYEEGNVYAYNICKYTQNIPDKELIRADTDLTTGVCVGIIGTDDDGSVISVIKAAEYDSASDALKENFDWFHNKFTRFSLVYYEFEELLGDVNGGYNRALACDYESPTKLKLRVFFDNYGGAIPTDEEWNALKDTVGFHEAYDFFRLSVDDMNDALKRYFGLTVDQMDPSAFSGLQYLESTNCYYYMATGAIYLPGVMVSDVAEQTDGTVQVYYTAMYHEKHVVTLKSTGLGYQIISNLPVTAPLPTTAPASTTKPVDTELAYFLELFRWSEERNPYNHALRVMYDFASPEEINLRSFYDGGLEGENEITDEEWAEYSKLVADPNNVHGDFHRLPKDKIEAELQAVFGISLADLPDSAFRGLFYLECSDSYCYNQSGVDSKSTGAFSDIIHNDDGTVSLIYEDQDGKCAITLKPNGDSYLIVSNIHVE